MTDIPIIFSAAMIRALLDGRKTMTRRLALREAKPAAKWSFRQGDSWVAKSQWQHVRPGDRLWVRENAKLRSVGPSRGEVSIVYDGDYRHIRDHILQPGEKQPFQATRLTPCIHMPRWASRLTLIVTATKIEGIQNITEADAKAEGMAFFDHGLNQYRQQRNGWHADAVEASVGADYCLGSARHAFGNLWEKLHGPNSWTANPEVVALTFTVHRTNIDAMPKAAAA